MPSYNHVVLIGNLTRDPELKYTPSGAAIADISIAINRVWKDDAGNKKEDTTFVDITLWKRTAEIVAEYCKKGAPIMVEGRLTLDTWDDKTTGAKRSKLKVTGENVQLLGQRKEGEPKDWDDAKSSAEKREPAKAPQAEIDDDSLPI